MTPCCGGLGPTVRVNCAWKALGALIFGAPKWKANAGPATNNIATHTNAAASEHQPFFIRRTWSLRATCVAHVIKRALRECYGNATMLLRRIKRKMNSRARRLRPAAEAHGTAPQTPTPRPRCDPCQCRR